MQGGCVGKEGQHDRISLTARHLGMSTSTAPHASGKSFFGSKVTAALKKLGNEMRAKGMSFVNPHRPLPAAAANRKLPAATVAPPEPAVPQPAARAAAGAAAARPPARVAEPAVRAVKVTTG